MVPECEIFIASCHINHGVRWIILYKTNDRCFVFPVAVVVAFFVCWAPFHAQRLMVLYVQKWTKQLLDIQMILFYISGVLYYISSTINPILYNIMSLKFRKAFRDTLLWRSCQESRRPQLTYSYKFSRRMLHSDTKSEVCDQGSPLPIRRSSGAFPVMKNSVIVSRGLQRSTPASVRVIDESKAKGKLYDFIRSKSHPVSLSSDATEQIAIRFAYRGTWYPKNIYITEYFIQHIHCHIKTILSRKKGSLYLYVLMCLFKSAAPNDVKIIFTWL